MAKITIASASGKERFGTLGDFGDKAIQVWAVDEVDGSRGFTVVEWWDHDVWIYEKEPPYNHVREKVGGVLAAQLHAIELLGGSDVSEG